MRRRNHTVVVHLNEAELAHLNRQCRNTGLRREALLRQLIAGMAIKPCPPDSYKELARELSAIGNNLNQIAHAANSAGRITETQIAEATEIMRQVWQCVQNQ